MSRSAPLVLVALSALVLGGCRGVDDGAVGADAAAPAEAIPLVGGGGVVGPAAYVDPTTLVPFEGMRMEPVGAVWDGERHVVLVSTSYDGLRVHTLAPDGTPLEPFGRAISPATHWQHRAAIAVAGDRYAVAYVSDTAERRIALGFLDDALAWVGDPIPVHEPNSASNVISPALAVGADQIWVAVADEISPSTFRVHRYTLDGAPIGTPISLGSNVRAIDLAFVDGRFVVAGYGLNDIRLWRITADGQVLDPGGVVVVDVVAEEVRIAGDGRGLVLAWRELWDGGAVDALQLSPGLVPRGTAHRIDDGSTALEAALTPDAVRVFTAGAVADVPFDGAPAITAVVDHPSVVSQVGGDSIVLTSRYDQTPRIARYDAARATAVRDVPLRLRVAAEPRGAIARSGARTLLGSFSRLSVDLRVVGDDGAPVTPPVTVPHFDATRIVPRAGGFWVVNGRARMLPVDLDGNPGETFHATSIDERYDARAADVDGVTLVAWREANGVRARRITVDGWVDAGSIPVSTGAGNAGLAVAGTADGWVVAWCGGGARAARVALDGEVVDLPALTLGAGTCVDTAVVDVAGEYHVVWSTAAVDGDLQLARVPAQGAPSPAVAIGPIPGRLGDDASVVADGDAVLAVVADVDGADRVLRWRADGTVIPDAIVDELLARQVSAVRVAPGRFLVVDNVVETVGDVAGNRVRRRTITLAGPGEACAEAVTCASGHCADGVCCDQPCGGDGDCLACSVAAGAAQDGVCAPLAAGTVCRAATGACDAAERCDGVTGACGADAPADDGTTCDDGDGCTTGDTCTAGACGGAPVACPDPGPCRAAECVPWSGECTEVWLADGVPCPDGVCVAGDCVFVEGDAGAPDASPPDAAVDAGASPDAGPGADGADDGGCCSAGTDPGAAAAPWVVVAALLARRRRRRRHARCSDGGHHALRTPSP